MTTGKKISATCIGIAGLAIVLGSVSLKRVAELKSGIHKVISESQPRSKKATKIRSDIRTELALIPLFLVAETDEDRARVLRESDVQIRDIRKAVKAYSESALNESRRRTLALAVSDLDSCLAGWKTLQSKPADSAAVANFRTSLRPAFQRLLEDVNAIVKDNDAEAEAAGLDSIAVADSATRFIWILLSMCIAAGAGAVLFVIRSVDGMSTLIAITVRDLKDACHQITDATRGIASASQSVANGASRQAAALEETSASSDQIASMTERNKGNARAASSAIHQLDGRIGVINEQLDKTLDSMKLVDRSSAKVTSIIKLIDEISFQTNILSLNAAVEAARAGESGLGFAVVAGEVRNLAQRCAQAARDTTELIEESGRNASECNQRLNLTADGVRSLTGHLSEVKMNVDCIDVASVEQSKGIVQVAAALTQLQGVTQNNAAAAENAAAASTQLDAQSLAMAATVRRLATLVSSD